MSGMATTHHALVRMAQRGMAVTEADLIMLVGSEAPDGYIIDEQACAALESTLKSMLDWVARAKRKRIVVRGGRLVTAYRASAKQQRRLRREAIEGGMY